MGAKSIQENCRPNGASAENHVYHSVCSRQNFFGLYQYLESEGLDYFGAAFLMNVSHHARSILEAESAAFYKQHFPHVQFNGFVGFESDKASQQRINITDSGRSYTADQMSYAKPQREIESCPLQPSVHRPFYFPTHMGKFLSFLFPCLLLDLWIFIYPSRTLTFLLSITHLRPPFLFLSISIYKHICSK